jgi:hypothetical protein
MRGLLFLAVLLSAGNAEASRDTAFQAHVRELATATKRVLAAWGSAKLDGSRPIRFAVLDEGGEKSEQPYDYVCGDHRCRAVLIVEHAPDKISLVAFDEDTGSPAPHLLWRLWRVMSWTPYAGVPEGHDATTAKPDDWRVLDDHGFRYRLVHKHGEIDVLIGLRDDTLVVFEVHDTNSRHSDVDAEYAREGGCHPRCPCPTLASFQHARLAKHPGGDEQLGGQLDGTRGRRPDDVVRASRSTEPGTLIQPSQRVEHLDRDRDLQREIPLGDPRPDTRDCRIDVTLRMWLCATVFSD